MSEEIGARSVDRVTQQINVWASIAHHQLAEGFGSPSIERCGLKESLEPDPPHPEEVEATDSDGVCTWDWGRADELYEASFRKYNPTGAIGYPTDPKSQLTGLLVDVELRKVGYPPLLVGLLLWLYPTCGDLAPRRPDSWDPDNPYRSFRPKRWVAETCGILGDKYHEQSIDRLLRSIENAFRRELSSAIATKREEKEPALQS